MAKYYGSVGYGVTSESEPHSGIYGIEEIVERNYYGDTLKTISKWTINSDSINDNKTIGDPSLSIIADPYAMNHFSDIKYVTYMGVKWKVLSVEVQRPRLILTIGGIYND